MTSEPQEATEHDEPNEYGFAGGATTPSPEPGAKESFGEAIAVPAGDLTGALMAAIDRAGHHDGDGARGHSPREAGPHEAGPHEAGPHEAGAHEDGPHEDGPHEAGAHEDDEHRRPG